MAKKKSTAKKSKILYADLEHLKHCPRCGKMSIMQHPYNMVKHILSCSACDINFKLEIV